MADQNEQLMDVNPQQVSVRTLALATLAAIAVEGPLLGMTGFSFLTSFVILVVTSPLLVIFSPLLLGAACVFAFAMAGFGVAGAMAVIGMSSFVVVYRSLIKGINRMGIEYGDTDVPATLDKMIEPSETVKEQQHDTEASGTVDTIEPDETVKEQKQDTSVPVTVDRMVELFESLKEHPHDTAEPIIEEAEEHQRDKDRATSSYSQQNVQHEIPQAV